MERELPQLHGRLLIVRRAVLNRVLTEILRLATVLEDQVTKSLKEVVQQVLGGIWRGPGAEAFVQEASSLLIPDLGYITNDLRSTSVDIATARDAIDQADEAGQQYIVDRLKDSGKFF